MSDKTNRSYKVWEPLLLSIAAVIGMFAGVKMAGLQIDNGIRKVEHGSGASRVTEIIRFIDAKYVDDVTSKALVDQAIKGILGELDPHSGYISPEELAKINERMEGSFEGIGVMFHVLKDTIVILICRQGRSGSEGWYASSRQAHCSQRRAAYPS